MSKAVLRVTRSLVLPGTHRVCVARAGTIIEATDADMAAFARAGIVDTTAVVLQMAEANNAPVISLLPPTMGEMIETTS